MKADSKKAKNLLKQHFGKLTKEEFKRRLQEHTPDTLEIALDTKNAEDKGDFGTEQAEFLFQSPRISRLPLSAYIATALTSLSEADKQYITSLSDMVADICRELNIDPYQPHRGGTDPVLDKDVSADEVFRIDREKVLNSDLLIHLCDFASTGAGEELIFAHDALLPIALIMHADRKASRMILGIPSFKIEIRFTHLDELKTELRLRLGEIRPLLEERKMAYAEFGANLVGNRIRELREGLGLSREEVARLVGLSEHGLKRLEESSDRIGNPTLLELRQLATVLRTTVADLVEPAIGDRLLVMLEQWMATGKAARFGMTEEDARTLLSRVLLRLTDGLLKGR